MPAVGGQATGSVETVAPPEVQSRTAWPGRDGKAEFTEGKLWPCELARKQLAEVFLDSEDRLSAQMARLMGVAAHDLGLSDSSKLYRRFVRWTVDGAMLQCGRCGRSGHQALPGLPPRLFPCDLKHGGQP